MLDNIYIVTDLGPGDGGKGGVVHALAVRKNASVIIPRRSHLGTGILQLLSMGMRHPERHTHVLLRTDGAVPRWAEK